MLKVGSKNFAKISSETNFSDAFLKGSTNYRKSNVSDHAKSTQHVKSCDLEEKQKCENEGRAYQKKVSLTVPVDSPIYQGLKKMSDSERTSMKVLFEAPYLNAKKGRPLSDFEDWTKWAEMQGLKLTVPYKNRTQYTAFVKYINNVLFDEHVRKKLLNVNFIAAFCDGSTDTAVIEKERIYMFADPETLEPVLTFLSLKDLPSQDATGIMSAITSAFADISLPELREKMVFLASDGASVNSGVKTGLAVKFRESGQEWLLFVWCLSCRLELALKDALADVMEPIKKCLTNLFYLYEKSSKKP